VGTAEAPQSEGKARLHRHRALWHAPGAAARERADVLNVGSFSDAVFDQIATFAEGRSGPERWGEAIGRIGI